MKTQFIQINCSTVDPQSPVLKDVKTDEGQINHKAIYIHKESVICIEDQLFAQDAENGRVFSNGCLIHLVGGRIIEVRTHNASSIQALL